ncbi:uncharacterized protein LOC115444756 [Manduca sexta]|uniref:Uncharacterized protein n=1 Tax=Manduca sexta TaxID=7130 RepID=A0A922CM27_MANSE|nr:uncharacterized protein LOC115444756 [Manduca sexta]KAG6452015.1 hypothetical protein O3G_MSEX007404 [Manduca sexta]
MKISECHHVRIRDANNCNIDVEKFIQSIEKQYKIDFRSIPQWRESIQRLHVTTTDCKRKIQDSNRRKNLIINKICLQWSRPSPFELTDKLARTLNKWRKLPCYDRKRKISLKPEPEVIHSSSQLEEQSVEASETAHQNTEIVPSEEHIEAKLKATVDSEVKTWSSPTPTHLPTSICTNPNKLISPLNSNDSPLMKESIISTDSVLKTEMETKEWLIFKSTLGIACSPAKLTIDNKSLKRQSMKFTLTNCTTEYIHARFVCVTDESSLKLVKILPETALRLYPGIAVTFKFTFKLLQNEREFESSLYFKVGHNVLIDAPYEACHVPIFSKFKDWCHVSVSDTVSIPPVYLWHIKRGYPKGVATVCVNDSNYYHVHIYKHVMDLAKLPDNKAMSLEVVAPTSQSLIQRIEDGEIEAQSNILAITRDETIDENELITPADIVALVLDEIIELCLETFLFEHTYLYMQPQSKKSFPVYFVHPHHIGKHQFYYDVEFTDPKTENVVTKVPIKVFAEVLPHPIQIDPYILDMSSSPITHGICEGSFVIMNTHKLYPATIKIKLTTKMKKLFTVSPMETLVPTTSSVNFKVRTCSREFLSGKRREEFAIFTFKIIVNGNIAVYDNVPPIFYEIIAPCALEFKKVYNENYYKEISEKSHSEMNNDEQF